MGSGRRGQAGAAVLIVLIALLIVLYVLFLPPAERAALLGEQPTGPVVGDGTPDDDHIIFSTVPSMAQPREPVVRDFAPFTVRTQVSGNALVDRESLEVRRTAFHNDAAELRFTLPENADNVLLSFSVAHANGGLQISLNGEQVYSQELRQRQPSPITLPASLLREDNVLSFSASPVGFAVWSSNDYSLRNVRVTADVTDLSRAEQTLRFVVRDKDMLDAAGMVFIPDCFDDPGRLTTSLNGQTVFSGFPACGIRQEIDFAMSSLTDGENVLDFSVEQGRYIIDQPTVFLMFEQDDQGERFSISSALLSRAVAEGRNVLLRLSFESSGAQGVISLNGEELAFRTNKRQFAAPVTQYVRAGDNELALVESSKDVTALEILLG